MQICSLYSGSSGNSVFLKLGSHSLLVDAGKSARTLCRTLSDIGTDISEIQSIFITHEHRDHVSALESLLKKHPIPVHIPIPCAEHMPGSAEAVFAENLKLHPILYTENLGNEGDLTVTTFPISHDSAAGVGFRFSFTENGVLRSVGYATDVGYLSSEVEAGLMGCEAVVIECNHDVDMVKEGPYPYILKKRILSPHGHLSNTDCADFCTRLAQNGTQYILLAHLSQTNNTPDLAYDAVFGALAGSGVQIAVAMPDQPIWLIREASHREETSL